MVAAITGLIVWVAVAGLLTQGRLGTVLSAGRAELAAPLLIGLVIAPGICERIWPAEHRPLLARGLTLSALSCPGSSCHGRGTGPPCLSFPSRSWPWTVPTGLRWTYGPAGRVIVSPAYHRLHHSRDSQGMNLGVVLTVWDVLVAEQLLEPFQARSDARLTRTGWSMASAAAPARSPAPPRR